MQSWKGKYVFLWSGMIGIKTPWGVYGKRVRNVAGVKFRQMLTLDQEDETLL